MLNSLPLRRRLREGEAATAQMLMIHLKRNDFGLWSWYW
jgi:hypothetical protein